LILLKIINKIYPYVFVSNMSVVIVIIIMIIILVKGSKLYQLLKKKERKMNFNDQR